MNLDNEDLKEIIIARLSRTLIYLQRYLKEIPKHLIGVQHKFEHLISELNILIQQLSPSLNLDFFSTFLPPKNSLPEDINYFELALNEIKTAKQYFIQSKSREIFKEIQAFYLEQKLSKIIKQLEEIKAYNSNF